MSTTTTPQVSPGAETIAADRRQAGGSRGAPVSQSASPARKTGRTTRRRFALGAGAVLLGGGESGRRRAAGAQTPEASATPAPGGTRIVEHGVGTTEVPVDPRRVVALHDLDNAYAIASLGFAPVGMGKVEEDRFARIRPFGPIPPELERATDVGLFFEPNLERIAALDPDLILGTTGVHEEVYDQLSAIAPTVLTDYEEGDVLANQRLLAGILGLEGRLDERFAAYERRVTAVRARHAADLTRLEYTRIDSYGLGAEDNFLLLSDSTPGARVLSDLGAERSATNGEATSGNPFPAISLERLADYDADVILLGVEAGEEPDPQVLALLAGTFAGQRGQIFAVDYGAWGFRVVDGFHVVLDDLEAILAANEIDTSGGFA